jgi:hypothetical protein
VYKLELNKNKREKENAWLNRKHMISLKKNKGLSQKQIPFLLSRPMIVEKAKTIKYNNYF